MTAGGVFPQTKPAPRAAGGSVKSVRSVRSVDGTRVLLGVLLLVIAVAAITAVVITASSGQTNLAIIIGIFAAAFFSRILC